MSTLARLPTIVINAAISAAVCLLPLSNALANHKHEHHDRGHHYGECKHHNKHHKHHNKHHHCDDYADKHRRNNTTYIVTPVQPVTRAYPPSRVNNSVCNNCGVVVAVNTVNRPAGTSGIGAVTGAVVGGVLGNQIGGGTGRQVATVAGAIGGGVVGHEIERQNSRSSLRYDVQIRMDNGSMQSYSFDQRPVWRRGEKVWLENGQISRRR